MERQYQDVPLAELVEALREARRALEEISDSRLMVGFEVWARGRARKALERLP